MTMTRRMTVVVVALAVLAGACGTDDGPTVATTGVASDPITADSPALVPVAAPGDPLAPAVVGDLTRGEAMVDQQALQECYARGGDCVAEVPGLAECMAAGLNCNTQGRLELEEQYAARGKLVTRHEAFTIAARGSTVPVPEPTAADLERFTVVTTYGAWRALSGGGLMLAADREVVVATAHGVFPQTDVLPGAPEPEPSDALTVVIDRVSGESLAVCYCAAVVDGRLVDALAGPGAS